MAMIGEKRKCPTCNESEKVMELIPNPSRDGWYTQKLSCGHTGRIRIMDPIEEKVEIRDDVKSVATSFSYGQVQADKTTKDSRSIPCKCGHRGNQHKFLKEFTGNHNCYLCKCPDYKPA